MTWADHHTHSEHLAAEAELATRQGATERAIALYRLAAEAEVQALADLDLAKTRTLGITAVSAVALWYKAHDYQQAERLAHKWLAIGVLPPFAIEQLQGLLQMIWSARARERVGVKFADGEVLVSAKGGEIVTGGAPLDLIVGKTEAVAAFLYRTAEFLVMAPHRKHRAPSLEIQRICRPWLFYAPPGSYQFAVRVQQPTQQLDLFPEDVQRALLIEKVIPTFLKIIRATAEDPEDALAEVVTNAEYRTTFLKLARNLAPTGEGFGQLEIKPASAADGRPIILLPGSRDAINHVLKKQSTSTGAALARQEDRFRGILRALHLDKDWLEITIHGSHSPKTIRIYGAGDEVDDVLGPMVNREVLVDVFRKRRSKKYFLRDIQAAE
jgi:hypothetical protein